MPPAKTRIPSVLTSKFQLSSRSYKSNNSAQQGNSSRSRSHDESRQLSSDSNKESTAKRLKACLRCRKSKVKCENNGEAPCKRCKQNGLECVFQMKIDSYSSKEIRPVNNPNTTSLYSDRNDTRTVHNDIASNVPVSYPSGHEGTVRFPSNNKGPLNYQYPNTVLQKAVDADWQNSMENKLENFNDTLNNILGFLKDEKLNSDTSSVGNQYHGPSLPYQRLPPTSFSNTYNIPHVPDPYSRPSYDSELSHPSAHSYPTSQSCISPYSSPVNRLTAGTLPGYKDVLSNDEVTRLSKVLNYQTNTTQPEHYNSGSVGRPVNVPPSYKRPHEYEAPTVVKKQKSLDVRNLRSLVSYSLFEELYARFVDKFLPQLFGFDVSHLDRKLIYVKSDLFVALISLIGAINYSKYRYSLLVDDLRSIYLDTVSEFILKSNRRQNSFGVDLDDDDRSLKLLKDDNVLAAQKEYDDYADLCGDANGWRKWSLLTKEEKTLELKKSKEFKSFINTAALCIATFWFENSQLLLGIALQLASELQLNKAYTQSQSKIVSLERDASKKNNFSYISITDKLKLWYLLYISDSQQSFLSQKQPVMSPDDFSLKHSRSLLFHNKNGFIESSEVKSTNLLLEKESEDLFNEARGAVAKQAMEQTLNQKLVGNSGTYNDLKLVSQLEFNQALNLVLNGSGWDILSPDLFGIPWKTNLELDKWMVHWTCYLTPIHHGNSWSIKSAMIYYNYARMHINNKFMDMIAKETGAGQQRETQQQAFLTNGKLVGSETDVDEEEFDGEFADGGLLHNLNGNDIAMLSAQTLLKAMTTDKDLIDNLRFAPLHIYVMLYYAALVLLDSGSELFTDDSLASQKLEKAKLEEFEKKAKAYFENIVLVRSIIKVMSENLPVDRDFGMKLIKSLKQKLEKKYSFLKKIGDTYNSVNNKDIDKIRQLDNLNDDEIKKLLGNSGDFDDKGQKILAWPGTNHQHP